MESIGSGIPVVSSPSPALEHLYGDVVLQASNAPEFELALDSMLDPELRARRSAAGWRVAHLNHAVDDGLGRLFSEIGVTTTAARIGSRWSVRSGDAELVRAVGRFCPTATVVLAPDPTDDRVALAVGSWHERDVVATRDCDSEDPAVDRAIRMDRFDPGLS